MQHFIYDFLNYISGVLGDRLIPFCIFDFDKQKKKKTQKEIKAIRLVTADSKRWKSYAL